MKILMAEDDTTIREGVSEYLHAFGYTVVEAKNGREALELFDKDIRLAILDIQMPFLTGLEVLQEIRKTSKIPVLMLTAFNDEEYKIDAFTKLADGYVEKPFSLPLLKVRVDSLMKKYYGEIETFEYKDTIVNFSGYTATVRGKKVEVNAKELEILKFLLEHEGQAMTRAQMLDHVWKETDEIPFDRVIDVYIKELRKKLELDCIATIRNVGYKLERP